ncbi:MAG: PKD domain-containing protein [Tannerella sp.]|jgi:hypothetical protein|nr:PKD domain-containing protein [Tannerella sp.]
MKKLKNSRIYLVLGTIVVCIAIAFIIRYFFSSIKIQAFVSSTEIYKGELLGYSDSTFRAKKWFWEFGNGDTSTEKSGEYKYKETGTYMLRLTVNGDIQKEFIINVRPAVKLERDSIIRIDAPATAMQDEFIVFRGIGLSKEWRWAFGATGIIDSRDQVAIYSYPEPGIYEVEVTTEETKYPVRHQIEIFPKYMENDSTDVLSLIGNDIREKLQAIVDGKPFNPNYNHIMTKYLCNNSQLLVVVNNDRKNDFYSYCQGLKILGKKNTDILQVVVVPDEERPACLQKLYVMQATRDE